MPEQGSDGTTWKREPWITDELVDAAAAFLRAQLAGVRIPQIVIAERFGLFVGQKRETRRRRVRELVEAMRHADHPIVANGKGIGWAHTHSEHVEYQEWRRSMGLAHLVEVKRDRTSPPAVEAAETEQLPETLFGDEAKEREPWW